MYPCETKLVVSSAVHCCSRDIKGEDESHVVVDVLVRNAQHVKYLDEDTLIGVNFDEGIVVSGLPMEIWACTENIAVNCPVNHRRKVRFERLKGYDLLILSIKTKLVLSYKQFKC